MSRDPVDAMTPRILVVDDERQIHASIRLRLAGEYELEFTSDAATALARLQQERFDLCFADLHMPGLDGLQFVAQAQEVDSALGFVLISAFDTAENVRRALPLRVYDFIGKPLPAREAFEGRVPDWVARTRRQRRQQGLAGRAETIARDLASARLAQEIEFAASQTARDALLQTSSLLTTLHAHIVTALAQLPGRGRPDVHLNSVQRNLEEARKTADAAITVAETFFDSAYGSRDDSPAMWNPSVALAGDVARRMTRAELQNKLVNVSPLDARIVIQRLSGMEFLQLMIPAIGLALELAASNSSVGISGTPVDRLDPAARESRLRDYLWLNRRSAALNQSGVLLTVTVAAPALSRLEAEAWLRGEHPQLTAIAARGLLAGLEKCRGTAAMAVAPAADDLRLVLFLPA